MKAGDRVRTDLVEGQQELEVLAAAAGLPLELAAEQGASVRAVRAGVVIDADTAPAEIIVQADNGDTYFYGHLESINVHEQQRVEEGRVLGQVGLDPGQQAKVTFRVESRTVDPAPFLTFSGPVAAVQGVPVEPAPTPAGAGQAPAVTPQPVPNTLEDAAEALRAAGWTAEPPHPPAAPAPAPSA